MKKLFIIAAAFLCLASCTKQYGYSETVIVGGSEYRATYPAREYLMSIADNMVTDVLGELETALKVDGNSSSLRFDMSAGSILQENVTWTVVSKERELKGMTLKNIGGDTWEMRFQGPYTLSGELYPVSFIMKAKRGTAATDNHYNWAVNLNGNRTEREGFSCSYSTSNPFLYICKDGNTIGWNSLEGSYFLTVFRGSDAIDQWQMEFNGSIRDADFSRGL